MRQLRPPSLLEQLGLFGPQCVAVLGNLVGRMAAPDSERAAWHWLRQRSALGELLGCDCETMGRTPCSAPATACCASATRSRRVSSSAPPTCSTCSPPSPCTTGPAAAGGQRGDPSRGPRPAHQQRRLGRRAAVAHLRDADRPGGRPPLPRERTGTAPDPTTAGPCAARAACACRCAPASWSRWSGSACGRGPQAGRPAQTTKGTCTECSATRLIPRPQCAHCKRLVKWGGKHGLGGAACRGSRCRCGWPRPAGEKRRARCWRRPARRTCRRRGSRCGLPTPCW